MRKNEKKNYVLVIPARNEERYIQKTLDSVISQTVLPRECIIVSDGSTDRTDKIVAEYKEKYPYINLLRVLHKNSRDFKSKVNAFSVGVKHLDSLEYDFIGNIDADVSFGSEFFERLLGHFIEDSKLGIGGGTILELQKGVYKERRLDRAWNVAGAIQLFRRQCYEEIGGFVPLKAGGEDTVAQIMARMKGWEVKTFKELKAFHHRPTGTGGKTLWRAWFNGGIKDYMLGYQKLYFIAKCLRRLLQRPYVFGSLVMIFGYCWEASKRGSRPMGADFIKFHRREQTDRLISRLKIGRRSRCESLH